MIVMPKKSSIGTSFTSFFGVNSAHMKQSFVNSLFPAKWSA